MVKKTFSVLMCLIGLISFVSTLYGQGSQEPRQGETYRDPTTGMEFVFVKGGCYEMGCGPWTSDCDDGENPPHEVCVSDFHMGRTEVTVEDFKRFINDTGYRTEAEKGDGCLIIIRKEFKKEQDKNWRNPGFSQNDNHPVVCVSHNDSVEYIKWLNSKTGRRYRLPTEAEWEYAARSGGKKVQYSWGDGPPSGNIADESFKRKYADVFWPIWSGYDDGYANTAPVGTYRPNELGLHDMTGNVWEWCQDWYDQNYYKNSPRNNPGGPGAGQSRVLRGGSWNNASRHERASYRTWSVPSAPANLFGFRLILSSD